MSNKCDSTYFVLLFLPILLLCSCQNNKYGKWQKYYLSPKLSNESLVYLYEGMVDDKMVSRYILHRKIQDTLKHIYYSAQGNPEQIVWEQLFWEGAKITKYTLYEDGRAIQTTPVKNSSFSFEPLARQEYLETSINWTSKSDSSENQVIKLRRFLKDSIVRYNGQKIPALVFETREQISNTLGNTFTYNVHGKEIYAKNIGLLYELKHIENAYRLSFELKRILSPDELEFTGQ